MGEKWAGEFSDADVLIDVRALCRKKSGNGAKAELLRESPAAEKEEPWEILVLG